MPDQPLPRRRFQFRLRTLMIGVTLCAVACWVILDRQRLASERDMAAQRESEAKATMIKQEESLRIYIDAFRKLEDRNRQLESQFKTHSLELPPTD
jgi:hypothetical protein